LKSEFIRISASSAVGELDQLPGRTEDGGIAQALPVLDAEGAVAVFESSDPLHDEAGLARR
jgi:hypothetical protein